MDAAWSVAVSVSIVKLAAGAPPRPIETFIRIPTRLTWLTPAPPAARAGNPPAQASAALAGDQDDVRADWSHKVPPELQHLSGLARNPREPTLPTSLAAALEVTGSRQVRRLLPAAPDGACE